MIYWKLRKKIIKQLIVKISVFFSSALAFASTVLVRNEGERAGDINYHYSIICKISLIGELWPNCFVFSSELFNYVIWIPGSGSRLFWHNPIFHEVRIRIWAQNSPVLVSSYKGRSDLILQQILINIFWWNILESFGVKLYLQFFHIQDSWKWIRIACAIIL